MSDGAALIYLETDDEVTSVVRRIRGTDAPRVVLVAPGRSRATSSVVALRLLARVGDEADRRLSVVGDALTRSLAVEAGLDAYGSVDDARNAVAVPSLEGSSKRAAIHVVRGPASDETTVTSTRTDADSDTETRPVPLAPRWPSRPRAPASTARSRSRGLPLALLLGTLAALVVGVGVIGAVILPAATVRIVPRSVAIEPLPYDIRMEDPQRRSGSVTATAPVTATGEYPIQARATGTVVLYNWTFFPVAVPAGTFVAAGEQAFATAADVVVPRGRLTSDGRIGAGDVAVGVSAAAVGPAANVPAKAIDVVVDAEIDQQLRGFPENPERRVDNPEPTAGGVDTTGLEFTDDDVSTAQAALLASLDRAVADELAGTRNAIFADPAEPAEAVIEGLDGLVGTRDQETAEISGSLAYDRLLAQPEEVIDLAQERFATDASVLPEGHELLLGAIEVEVGGARRDGDALVVPVSVRGASTAAISRDEVIERIKGRSQEDATATLDDLGDVSIDLWPSWVGEVPRLDWRIDVVIAGTSEAPPTPSASGSLGP